MSSVVVSAGWAQNYPSRAIRFITVGADDALPRLLAQELGTSLGQQVFVEDHPGASGTLGAEFGARAPADGYNFLISTGSHAVTPYFYKLNYDILRDFEHVSLLATTAFVLLAHPSLPVNRLGDLVALAKAKPGQLNYASSSAGSAPMLTGELFKAKAGVNIVHVPYKSILAAMGDMIAGQVHLSSSVTPSAVAQVRSGRARALAVSTAKRVSVLPEVPTFAEQGYPEVVTTAWYGLSAPAKTPAAVIARMNAEVVKTLRTPAVRDRIGSFALEPAEGTPAEFTAFIKAELARWGEAVKVANVPKND
jgi:tripartite-type tricarboxylate transporter receptor subunit TctC